MKRQSATMRNPPPKQKAWRVARLFRLWIQDSSSGVENAPEFTVGKWFGFRGNTEVTGAAGLTGWIGWFVDLCEWPATGELHPSDPLLRCHPERAAEGSAFAICLSPPRNVRNANDTTVWIAECWPVYGSSCRDFLAK